MRQLRKGEDRVKPEDSVQTKKLWLWVNLRWRSEYCFYLFKQHYFRTAYAGPSSNICPSAIVLGLLVTNRNLDQIVMHWHAARKPLASKEY